MKSSLREILIESHVAAVAIAVLLLGALDWAFQGLAVPLGHVAAYSFTAVAILGIPYSSPGVTPQDRLIRDGSVLVRGNVSEPWRCLDFCPLGVWGWPNKRSDQTPFGF